MSAGKAAMAVLSTIAGLVVVFLLVLVTGAYNVAATQDHSALGSWILDFGQQRSVAVRADDEVPAPPVTDSAMVAHGFEHYREMCVTCHGAPGVDRGEIGKGITPTPPDLTEEATEMDTRRLFWIVKHGIKLAGMPAFGPTHSDHEIWSIVAFVERLPDMGESGYASWQARYSAQ